MVELYNHNKETYDKAVAVLDKYNKVLIVQAPSTGKSFILMKLIQEKYTNKRILIVIPTYSIRFNIESYKEWDGHNVTFYSYSYICSKGCDECMKDFDVIVFDEVHHAGARLWGQVLEWTLDNNKTCIGLTATPVRSSDGKDISKMYFSQATVYGLDIAKAIETNTLSEFSYFLVLGDITKRLEESKAKLDCLPVSQTVCDLKSEYAGLNLSDISNYELSTLVQSNIKPNKPNKWLVFCSKRSEMEDIEQDIHEWFGTFDMTVLKVDSTNSRKQIKERLNTFNAYTEDKPIVLVSINILNEGLHVNGVTGLIFLRRTKSLSIFIQQCGRGLTTDKSRNPVIIDAVENISSLRYACSRFRESSEQQQTVQSIASSKITDILTIKDTELLDIVDFIDSVNRYDINSELSQEEIVTLRTYWPDVYRRINKPKAVILRTARELGLVRTNKFNPDIDQKIRELYPKEGSAMASIVGLTKEEVRRRAQKLGVKYNNRWSVEDDMEVLLGNVPSGRTEEECKSRLEELRRKLV